MASRQQQHDDCPFRDVVFPERTSEPDRMMDTRVGRLEGVVESLTNDIREVSQNINTMGKELGNFRETIGNALARMRDDNTNQLNAVTDRLTASNKPQWQTISAFVVLAITVLGMAGAVVGLMLSGQSERITRLQNDTGTITERMFTSQYEKGKSDAFAARLEESIKDYNAWRLEHATTGAAADAKLQAKQEMVLDLVKSIEIRIDRVEALHRNDINRLDAQQKK